MPSLIDDEAISKAGGAFSTCDSFAAVYLGLARSLRRLLGVARCFASRILARGIDSHFAEYGSVGLNRLGAVAVSASAGSSELILSLILAAHLIFLSSRSAFRLLETSEQGQP